MAIGIPLSLLGLALRAWAAGCLAKNQQLATGGPYAYTRNPLYIGTLLVAAGIAVASRSIGLAALFTAVFLLVYLPVIQNEEQHLRKIFPEYADYAERVPALVPRLKPAFETKMNPFRAGLYLKNQEYQAGLGFLAGMLFLFWKMLG
jgi:protein-S-isoprenylcysteine O-methyltransferase Ste14